jgi:ABC-type lipoprotein release transport system permease subunit
MLTGQELLSFVKANADMDQNELAREAGYVKTTDKGTERLLINKLHEALLEAKGVKLKTSKKPGKAAQYVTTVHRTGVILVGKTYSEKFGVEPGDELKILIEDDSIRLVPQAAQVKQVVSKVAGSTAAAV